MSHFDFCNCQLNLQLRYPFSTAVSLWQSYSASGALKNFTTCANRNQKRFVIFFFCPDKAFSYRKVFIANYLLFERLVTTNLMSRTSSLKILEALRLSVATLLNKLLVVIRRILQQT